MTPLEGPISPLVRGRRPIAAAAWAAVVIVAACLGALAVHPASGASPPSGVSTDYTSNGVSPPAVAYTATAYDPADGYVVMFGGLDVNYHPTPYTWVFARGNWTNLTGIVGSAPPPLYGAGAAYDPQLGEVILYGGCLNSGCTVVSDATWAYAHDRWTNITAQVGAAPAARGRTMMTYDGRLGEILMFGGVGSSNVILDDTWLFNGTWTPFANGSSPSPPTLAGAGMAYDAALQQVVLFGGNSGPARVAYTWVFGADSWSNVTGRGGAAPSARWGAGMAYDSEAGYVLLVNGCTSGNYLGDEWSYSGSGWTLRIPPNAPPATCGSTLVDDPGDGYVLFYSGDVSNGELTSTYIYAGGSWTLLVNPPASDLGLITLLVLVPLVFALGLALFLVRWRARRRRDAALAEAFPLRPGEPVTWVETSPDAARAVRRRLLPLRLTMLLLLPILFLAGLGISVLFGLLLMGLIGGPMLLAATLGGANLSPTSIGIAQPGIIVRRKSGEIRIPWAQLQPGHNPPYRGVVWFQFYYSGPIGGASGFNASLEQARAIIQSPFAPAWILAPLLANGLGLPFQRTAGPPVPPSPPPPTSTGSGAPTYAGPLPASGPTYSPVPPPPPATAATGWDQALPSSPPAPRPYASPYVPPPPPTGPPPGMLVCPKCGQLNRMTGVMFCGSCGQRLHP